jgi:hypothetical protein
MTRVQDKKGVLKATREECLLTYKEKSIRMTVYFLIKNSKNQEIME